MSEASVVTDIMLAEADAQPTDGQWLVLGGEASLANGIHGDVSWMPLDVRERSQSQVPVVACDAVAAPEFARVVLPIPANRGLARALILRAQEALALDGRLLIAGANAVGAKSVLADAADVFGKPLGDAYRQKHRIARFVPREVETQPAWATEAGIAPHTWATFSFPFRGEVVSLDTQAGVFAAQRLDAGTRLLLDALPDLTGKRVLDVGCGAGVIGVAAAKAGAVHIDMTDPNLLAVTTAARNAAAHGLIGDVLASDVYDAVNGRRYDAIFSNPPFHQGKAVDLSVANRILTESPVYMEPGGSITVVANAFLAYGKTMERVFRHVETVAATSAYHVVSASDPR